MKTVELHFPKLGVNRRGAERDLTRRGVYDCPWAVNVRLDDNFDRRLRGGSRPGLTKFVADDMGTTISDIASIDVSSESGGSEPLLVVLVDSTVKTISGSYEGHGVFDGASYITANSAYKVKMDESFDISFTVNGSLETGTSGEMLSWSTTANDPIFLIRSELNTGKIAAYWRNVENTDLLDTQSAAVVFNDTDRDIRVTYDGSGVFKLYVDGNLEINETFVVSGTFIPIKFTMGAMVRGSVSNIYEGTLRDVVIHGNGALQNAYDLSSGVLDSAGSADGTNVGVTFSVAFATSVKTGILGDEAGGTITADDGSTALTLNSTSAPSSGFLVTGQQNVFVVTGSAVSKLDPKTGQVNTLAASAGTVPTSATFGAIYRDRMFLAGGDNAIYCSSQGDYADWDFGKDVGNVGRAVAFQLSLGNDVGPLPTAMISHKDDSILLSTARTLWALRGDPTTGNLQRVSENIGIISSRAWCKVEDSVYFLSEVGIYQVGADGSGLSILSEEVPDELRGIDTSTVTVMMGYENDRKTIHVYLKTSAGSDTHWVYELASKSWWPVRLQNAHSPLAVVQHTDKLLLGGSDGFLRYIGGNDDDGTAIESHCIIGPMRLGSIDRDGIINMIRGMLATGSGTVTWRVVTGDYAEEAADNAKLAIEAHQSGGSFATYVSFTDTWTAGRSLAQYPRTAGAWACLRAECPRVRSSRA